MAELGSIGFGLALIGAAVGGAAFLTWFERRLLGIWQDRLRAQSPRTVRRTAGAGRHAQAADQGRLGAALRGPAVFVLAPTIIVIVMMLALAVVPFSPELQVLDLNIGLLFFLAMTSLAVYSVMLGGLASNNKYALLGGLRSAAQMVSYEVFMGLSLMGVVMLSGSFSLRDIVEAQRDLWFCVPQFLGCWHLHHRRHRRKPSPALRPARGRARTDRGISHRIRRHEVRHVHARRVLGLILICCMMVVLFFGGWLGPVLPPFIWFCIKVFVLICFFILLRAAIPRPRYDQLMALGWKYMLPLTLINLVATGGYRAGNGGYRM
jgi:NADH-quinone oxidoreductase subunit H